MSGKIAVVTGGAQGLGLAIARRLSEEACTVWILDKNHNGSIAAEHISTATGNPVYFYKVDITEENHVSAAFQHISDRSGMVHVLVNNAARFLFKGPDASSNEWDQILAVNVKGTSAVTHHCVPLLSKSGGGSIINLSSVSGFIGQPEFATYNATKFAIRGLTKCWSIDLAKLGIRVNTVCPGYIWTDAFTNSCIELNRDIDEENERVSKLHVLGRQGKPEEVASAVAFLASEDASFITGTDLMVDGGYLAM